MQKGVVVVIFLLSLLAFTSFSFAFSPAEWFGKYFSFGITGKVIDNTPFVNTALCNDSDGGIYTYRFGNVTYNTSRGFRTIADICTLEGTGSGAVIYGSGGSGSGSSVLTEYYCNESRLLKTQFNCPEGCSKGACVNLTALRCQDSDKGRNYSLAGTATQAERSVSDACLDSTTLREAYCSGTRILNVSYNCIAQGYAGCQEGRCTNEMSSGGGGGGSGSGPSLFAFNIIGNSVALTTTLKNNVTIILPFLYTSARGDQFIGTGRNEFSRIAAPRVSYVLYNYTEGDRFLILSSTQSSTSQSARESVIVRFTNFYKEDNVNSTEIEYWTSEGWVAKRNNARAGDFVQFGRLTLKIDSVDIEGAHKSVLVSAGDNSEFANTIYDNNGNYVFLPASYNLPTNSIVLSVFSPNGNEIQRYFAHTEDYKGLQVTCEKGCGSGEIFEISVATNRQDFWSDEQLILTDPPSTVSSSLPGPEAWLGNMAVQQEDVAIEGYLVELHGQPFVERQLAAADSLRKLERRIATRQTQASTATIFKPLRNLQAQQLQNEYLTLQKNVVKELQQSYQQIAAEHRTALASIGNVIGEPILARQSTSIQSARQISAESRLLNEHTYLFNGFALNVTSAEAEKIAQLPEVKKVSPNFKVYASLDSAVPALKLNLLHTPAGLAGDNVTIAIIDTGIDASHPALDDLDDDSATNDTKVIAFKDYINFRREPYDDQGHGTHVSGIAAGTAAGSDYQGVAPHAKLVGVKVLDEWGSGSFDGVISGIEWTIQNKRRYNISIISMSLGASLNSDGTTPVERAVDYAVAQGINVIVAAGNSGRRGNHTVGIPASAFNVTTVGAVYDDLIIAGFSSRGPTKDNRIKPDVSAVGVNVISSVPRGDCDLCDSSGYLSLSGTSMATPMVSGTAALLLQHNPSLTPAEIKEALMKNSLDRGISGIDNDYGAGVVDGMQIYFEMFPPEHELAITAVQVPHYFLVGESGDISYEVTNYGFSRENIEVNLIREGEVIQSAEFSLDAHATLNNGFIFTAQEEGISNFEISISPIEGEEFTDNNAYAFERSIVQSKGTIKAVVVDSWGANKAEYTIFDELENAWYRYGSYLLDIDYTSLRKEGITYEEIAATNADVLIISNAWSGGQSGMNHHFTDSEIAAITRYVEEGHGLIGTAGSISELVPNNVKLTALFGLEGVSGHWNSFDDELDGAMHLLVRDDILTKNISDKYIPGESHTVTGLRLNTTLGSTKVAVGASQEDVFVSAYKPGTGASVYFTGIPEYATGTLGDNQFFYNSIVWSNQMRGTQILDLAVENLEVPKRSALGRSIDISARVRNNGASSEEVRVEFKVNGASEKTTSILLEPGEQSPVMFTFIPQSTGAHVIQVAAVPIPGETYLINNIAQQTLVVPGAVFNDKNSEALIDKDNDGLADFIAVTLGVRVSAQGTYATHLKLTSFLGVFLGEAEGFATLPVGQGNITAYVYLPLIEKLELDGPYRVTETLLANIPAEEESSEGQSSTSEEGRNKNIYWEEAIILDNRTEAFMTSAYIYELFELPSEILLVSSYGVDENNNGMYDSLLVNVSVNISLPGRYSIQGVLELPDDQIGTGREFNAESSGVQNVFLDYPGIDLRRSGINGSIILRDLSLQSYYGEEDYIRRITLEKNYSFDEFERFKDVQVSFGYVPMLLVGKSTKIEINFYNRGSENVEAFVAELTNASGSVLGTKNMPAMKPRAYTSTTFDYTAPLTAGEVKLRVAINVSDDDTSNNQDYSNIRIREPGADLNIHPTFRDEPFVVGEPKALFFVIYNEGTESAKNVQANLYEINRTYNESSDKWDKTLSLIGTLSLPDVDVSREVRGNFSYTPRARYSNLMLQVNASNEIWSGNNEEEGSLYALASGVDLSVYRKYGGEELNMVAGVPYLFTFSIRNGGVVTAEHASVAFYKVNSFYNGTSGEYEHKKVFLESKTVDDIASEYSSHYKDKEVSFSYTPGIQDAYTGQGFAIEVSAEGDVEPENNIYQYGQTVAPQSRLYSKIRESSSGNLSIIVERYNQTTNEWIFVPEASLINLSLTIGPGQTIKLDEIYNASQLRSPWSAQHRISAKYVYGQEGYTISSVEPWLFSVYNNRGPSSSSRSII